MNPDKPDNATVLYSLSLKVFTFLVPIKIYGKNFTDSKMNFELYLEDFKVDTSRITKWTNDSIIFYLRAEDKISKYEGTQHSFSEQVTWQNFKYGTSGSYTNSGTYSLDLLPEYKITFKKNL